MFGRVADMTNENLKVKAMTTRAELILELENEKLSNEERRKIKELLREMDKQYGELDANLYA